ncbi:UBX domain-containing protein 10 [Yamadazyma tenuis]|nr:UBX domain-containing protein 10 [Yamadazyma tenuis]
MSSAWFQRLFSNHQPLPNGSNNNSSSNIPGAYPQESGESVEPSARNRFNSRNIELYLSKALEYIQMVVIKPIIFILFVVFTVFAKLINTIYFRDQFKRHRLNSGTLYDPLNKSNKFIRDIEDNLQPGQNHDMLPPFYQGSYTQALYMATHKAKFLFVYLTNPENENNSSIFNKVVINDKFKALFNDPDFIIWGGDLTNPESYQLANSLNVTKFPFLGLLALTRTTTMSPNGPVKSTPKISLLVKIQGEIGSSTNVNALIQNKFVKKIEKYEPELRLIRKELLDKFINQVFTQQQDLNYQRSLAKDRLKKEQKMQEQLEEEYFKWKLDYFNNLNLEEITDKAKIAIKIPNGERVTRLFPADSDISEIFDYVELTRKDYFNKSFDKNVDPSKLVDFRPTYKFKLMSPLPPKITLNEQLNNNILIKHLNCIYPNGLLIVEELE